MKKHLLTLLVICLAISACTARNERSAAGLIGSWKLTSYGPAASPNPAVDGAGAELTFNKDGTVTGTSGCNGLGGNYKVEGDQITFDQIASTLMACDDPHMAQEGAVHQVITNTASFKIEGSTLTLTNNENVLILMR